MTCAAAFKRLLKPEALTFNSIIRKAAALYKYSICPHPRIKLNLETRQLQIWRHVTTACVYIRAMIFFKSQRPWIEMLPALLNAWMEVHIVGEEYSSRMDFGSEGVQKFPSAPNSRHKTLDCIFLCHLNYLYCGARSISEIATSRRSSLSICCPTIWKITTCTLR